MSKPVLRVELKALLQLSKPNISSEAFETTLKSISPSFDWHFFLERAIATNLAGYLLPYPELAEKYYPVSVLTKIKSYQQKIQLHSIQLLDLLHEIVLLLEQKQITYAVLKGCAGLIAGTYDFKKRQISDIDILIDPNKIQDVFNLLQEHHFTVENAVYKSVWHQKEQIEHAPIQAYKNGLSVDIHTRLFRKDSGYQISTHEILQHTTKVQFNQLSVRVMHPNEAALFNTLHIHKHLYFNSLFKLGGLYDLQFVDFEALEALSGKWKARTQLHQMKALWYSWQEEAYDRTFLGRTACYALSQKSVPVAMKFIILCRRLVLTPLQITHPKHYFYSLFPNKAYLNKHYGKGPYLFIWLKRIGKLFGF
jgi:hypothetical protein